MQIEVRTKEQITAEYERNGFVHGCYKVMNQDYHTGIGISSSLLKEFATCPESAGFRHKGITEQTLGLKPRDRYAMDMGSQFHEYLLEPQEFEANSILEPLEFAGKPKNKGKALGGCAEDWKQFKADNAEKVIIDTDKSIRFQLMKESIMKKPLFKAYLRDGIPELSIYWRDDETGLQMKCRPDLLCPRFGIMDLKTTRTDLNDWARKVKYNFAYIQAAHYLAGVRKVFPEYKPFWRWLVVKTDIPFNSRFMIMDHSNQENYETEYEVLKANFAQALRSNNWDVNEEIEV